MADDNYILITARLDKGASIGGIQDDLNKIANKVLLQLHHVEISQAGAKSLKQSLKTIQDNLTLNINAVTVDQTQTIKQAQQISQNISNAINVTPNLGNVKRAFEEIQTVIDRLNPNEHAQIFGDLDSLSEFVRRALPAFQDVKTSINSWYKGTDAEVERVRAFTAEVHDADGAVEKLSFHLANLGSKDTTPVWEFSNASATDNAIKMQEQAIKLQEQLEKQIAKSSNTSLKLTNNLEGVKRKLSDVLQAHGSDTNITTYLNQAVDAITKLNSADGKNFDKLKINAEDAIRRYTDYLNSLKAADAKAEQAQRKLSSEIERSYKHLAHYVQIMDNLSERQIFNKNASNVGVVGLQDDIKTADELFKALKKDFESGKISPAMLDDIKTLNSRVTDVIANAHEMARTLGQSQTNVVHEEEVNYLKTLYNNLKASDVALDEFKADYQELNALLSQAQTTGDYTQYFTQLDIFKSKFTEAKTEIKATTAATSELEKMSKSLASNKMNTFFDKNAGNVQVNALKTEISGLINEWTTLKTEIDNTGRVTHTMQTRLDDLKVRMQNATTAADMLQANIKHIANAQRLATQQQSLDTRISSWLQNNTRASAETIASLKNLQAQIHDADSQTMFNLNNQFRQITANARAAGEAGLKLSDIIKQKLGKFAGWFSIATVVMRGVNKLKEMYRTVVELNTAMVGLRKVTDETDAVYDKFFTDAAKNAKILGASIKDIIDSTTEFARLGYSLADSQLLAQMATLYKNVGDGIDIGQATSNLISTMKAFGLSANEVESIIDKFNKVKTCPFYALVKRDRRQIFSNCWEFLKLFCLLYRRRKPETSEQIAYGEIKAFWKCEHSKRPKCGLMDSQQPSYIYYRRYTDYKGIAA